MRLYLLFSLENPYRGDEAGFVSPVLSCYTVGIIREKAREQIITCDSQWAEAKEVTEKDLEHPFTNRLYADYGGD